MRIDPPRWAWYRQDEQPPAGPALSAAMRSRDTATARALQAYLAARPAAPARSTVTTAL